MVSMLFRYPQAFGSLNRIETLDLASNYYVKALFIGKYCTVLLNIFYMFES